MSANGDRCAMRSARPAPRAEILAALRAIGYGGKFVDDAPTVSKVEEH